MVKKISEQKLPIIEFRTSEIYNAVWPRPKKAQPPPDAVWAVREKKLQHLWAQHGRNILRGISHITGLPWREDRIIVYLNWGVRPFSDPVTISLHGDIMVVFEALTHELIHRHINPFPNWKAIRVAWVKMRHQYPRELPIAVNHIPIHAVHEVLWRKLFPRRIRAIKTDLQLKPYVRSWALVDAWGADAVIRQIFEKRPVNKPS